METDCKFKLKMQYRNISLQAAIVNIWTNCKLCLQYNKTVLTMNQYASKAHEHK